MLRSGFYFLGIFLLPVIMTAQESSILQVVDITGEPLEKVRIHNLDYSFDEFTDSKGLVEIYFIREYDTLFITSIGFKSRKMPFSDFDLEDNREIVLLPLQADFQEIVIIGKTDMDERTLPYLTKCIGEQEIVASQSSTSADLLADIGGLFVQKSQLGGGSPIIRGFEANRVLLVVDGVRMNNAIYRSGHLQNAITVDPMTLQRVDIILGPGSLLYGSSALGGVVHYTTKDPMLNLDGQKAKYNINTHLRAASANREKTFHLDGGLSSGKWGMLSSITLAYFGDLRSGKRFPGMYPDFGKRPFYVETGENGDLLVRNDEPHIQVGTSYNQVDLLHKLKFQPNLHFSQTINVQYSRSSEIPRYDLLTEKGEGEDDLEWAEWYYGPQKRLLITTTSQWLKLADWFDKGTLIAAYQKIDEDRINRKMNSNRRFHQNEDVQIASISADLERMWSLRRLDLEWNLGFNSYWDRLKSNAYSEDIYLMNLEQPELTRYPDDRSNMYSFGIYSHWHFIFNDKFDTHFGVRYSSVKSTIRYSRPGFVDWPDSYFSGIRNQNNTLTWSINANYLFDKDFLVRLQVGSAFRAPNIDDLAKIRIKQGFVTAPNPDLKPEKTVNAEIYLAKRLKNSYGKSGNISLTGFYSHLKDAVIQSLYYLPNMDTLLFNEDGWYRIVGNVNAESGNIWGVSCDAFIPISASWNFNLSIHYTRGRSKTNMTSQPLAHIPPLYGLFALSYQVNILELTGITRFNGKKPVEDFAPASSDNLEYATPEGSLAWVTLNSRIGIQFNKQLKVSLGIENIFDIHYRTFSSGISQPGRNFIISLVKSFNG